MDTNTSAQQTEEFDLEHLLSQLDDLIAGATSDEDEGDAALAIRSISW